MNLFFIINQSIYDGSAHALYCYRNCWWLAKTRPHRKVHLCYPFCNSTFRSFEYFGLPLLPNLVISPLPAIRKPKGARGFTINLVFYISSLLYLTFNLKKNDLLVTASFLKLFNFLLSFSWIRKRCSAIYEVHQLAILDDGKLSPRAKKEFKTLEKAALLITTTGPLQSVLKENVRFAPTAMLGLACGFNPATQPPPRIRAEGSPFVVGYIGSLYSGQGVDWLIENWDQICGCKNQKIALEIVGGSNAEVEKLKQMASSLNLEKVLFHGAVPSAQLSSYLIKMDALVIPSLPVGRMPFVAITKAYDYLGMNRPVLASNLPSITEILRPSESYPFTAGDPSSFAEVLKELLRNPAEAERRAHSASQTAREFSWSARAERWWKEADALV
jgi:glycosyltransferase involved in cell wall biosynthesis